jgi:hypothetical protein
MTRVSDLANTLSSQGRASEIEGELEKLDLAKLTDAEREEWWHIYGITAFEGGRGDIALERFQRGYDQFPDSAMIRFALGQQYICAKEPDKGFALFREAAFPEIPQRHALVEARYAYLYSRYEDARAFIRPFFAAYKKLKILDDTFLYMRGLPFFGSYWNHLAAFSVLSGDWAELDEVTAYVSKNCSDYDFDTLRIERDAYRRGDAVRLLPALRRRIEESKAVPAFPTGFTRLMIAVIEAGQAPTMAAAQDIIVNVALAKNDFPWLQDVKTLALAEAAHRFGDSEAELTRVATFLERQPLLFEPDIALEFGLLGIQERLKADSLRV